MKIILIKPYFECSKELSQDFEFYKEPKDCTDAEAIIGFGSNVKREILEQLPNLKWIQLLSAGYDDIDLEYLKSRNIVLTNARGVYSVSIAEDVVCKILMSSCNVLSYVSNKTEKMWKVNKNRKELCGQTVGIIGTGSIAVEIAKRLQNFGVRVIGYRRKSDSLMPYFNEIYTGLENLNVLLEQSDYVVVAVNLNEETMHLLNKDNLKYMKEDSTIVNISRGSVINENDLIEALQSKKIKFAGLDVFEKEPLPQDSPLWDMDNVYMTPHCSGTVCDTRQKIYDLIIENVNRYKNGQELINLVSL